MAVTFAASTDRYIAETGLPAGQVWSVTCWARLSADRNDYSSVFGLHGTGSDFGVGTAADGTTLNIYDANGENAAGSLTVGAWARLAVTVNSTAVKLYSGAVTGALSSTSMTRTPPNPATSLYIGSDKFAEWWNGSIAAFKMWQAELSAAEVTAELGQFAPVRSANLLRYHPFHTAEVADHSGNGNALTPWDTSPTTTADPPGLASDAPVRITHRRIGRQARVGTRRRWIG